LLLQVSGLQQYCVSLFLVPYILESNPHPFYSFRGLKMQMQIRIECGLDSRSRAGVCPNDRAGVRTVRTIQGSKNEVWIRFGCGLDSRIYGISNRVKWYFCPYCQDNCHQFLHRCFVFLFSFRSHLATENMYTHSPLP
jgi:hypothetical protein